jgi:hypothetical protein
MITERMHGGIGASDVARSSACCLRNQPLVASASPGTPAKQTMVPNFSTWEEASEWTEEQLRFEQGTP